MLVRLLVKVDIFSYFPIMDLQRKKQYSLILSATIHLMKFLHNYNTQNDTLFYDTFDETLLHFILVTAP